MIKEWSIKVMSFLFDNSFYASDDDEDAKYEAIEINRISFHVKTQSNQRFTIFLLYIMFNLQIFFLIAILNFGYKKEIMTDNEK